jgi:hypothetical protein
MTSAGLKGSYFLKRKIPIKVLDRNGNPKP